MKKNGKIGEGLHTSVATRPSQPEYNSEQCDLALKFAILGAPDLLIANFLNLADVATLEAWKQQYPDFAQALREGRELADASVSMSLLRRAQGYNVPYKKIYRNPNVLQKNLETGEFEGDIKGIEEGVNHVPADLGAIKLWLHTRRPELWPTDMKPKGPVDPLGKPIEMQEDLVELIVARVTSRRTRKLTAASSPDPADEPES